MAIIYFLSAMFIVFANLERVPEALNLIIENAFDTSSAAGGFAGSAMALAMQYGISRGVFSNEAGLGSAPIAHAAAKTNSPVRQGTIAVLGVFFDTIIICTLTALVILICGVWLGDAQGVDLTSAGFAFQFPYYGNIIVTISVILFAFTTILGWSYYGERCSVYVFGEKAKTPYRILWILFIIVGAWASNNVELIWSLASFMNGFMAIPNLIALVLLSPVIFKLSKEYFIRK
jgi:AGCS family alanine or glycine:cation symporter